MKTTVLKLGGELLEDAAAIGTAASAIVRLAADGPLAVVHGGGRAIDAELRARGLSPRFVDGLRVTDEATLDAVVCVLGGRTNTALVAAVGAAGGRPVGLTGADDGIGRCARMSPLDATTGGRVDLGLVGHPIGTEAPLLTELLRLGRIPIVASIGSGPDGGLLNVNADVLAAHLARVLAAARLIVAGTTAGVLDADGRTIPRLDAAQIEELTASGAAHSGMIAKLAACRQAAAGGVAEISIVAGRGTVDYTTAPGTRITTRSLRVPGAAELRA